MAKSKNGSSFWSELWSFDLYKRNQGRLTRQVTALAVALIVALGAWSLAQGPLSPYERPTRVGFPLAIALVGAWCAFRLVNYPRFADFLISVEAEMGKVSWSSWPELYRATIVVLVTMFFLGFVLLGYDIVWQAFFRWIEFLEI